MTCSNCSIGIEKYLNKINGINKVTVQLLQGEMDVDFEDDLINTQTIIQLVNKLGYKAYLSGEKNKQAKSQTVKLKRRFLISLVFLLPLLYFSMGEMLSLPVFEYKINVSIHWLFHYDIFRLISFH